MDKLLDLTRDFDAAKAAFEAYLDEYDRADDKVHLKIVHTYGVVDAAEDIARRMGLGEEDVQLAKVIGLLHDIGRFEQIKRFDSFEPGTMEHAAYGAQLLFGPEKMIRRFVKDDRFDSLICTAIEKHSDFKLEGITDERTLLHAKLIRDADKLDNCRVKLEESMETLLGVDEKGVGEGVIAPKVWESCMAKESVLSSDRVSKVDYWISYIAQYYDINFPETYEIMREHDYVKRIMDRVPYALPETQEKMDILVAEMEEYMDERIRNKNNQEKFTCGELEYQVIRSARKTMTLEVRRDGNVIVRAPLRTGLPRIKRFVNQKQEWVLGCLERTKEYREQKPLSADLSESKRNVYIRKAKETITKRVSYFARLMGVSYRNITIREQKTRWGSCSSEKNLNFNWKLILAPPEVLDYVVVHELCHLKEMNHSKAFWDEVGKVMPEYETYKLWLKENGWKL